MGEVVLDSSALIAFLEAGDALHERAVAASVEWRRPELTRLIPASSYSEVLVAPSRAGVLEEWEADFAGFDIEVVPIDLAIARVAAGVRAARPALRLSAALVVATALVRECDLVTLDRGMREAHRALAAG